MQKTLSQVSTAAPKEIGRKPNGIGEWSTFMCMCEDNIVEVPFNKLTPFRANPQSCESEPSLQGCYEKQRLWWYRQDVV